MWTNVEYGTGLLCKLCLSYRAERNQIDIPISRDEGM